MIANDHQPPDGQAEPRLPADGPDSAPPAGSADAADDSIGAVVSEILQTLVMALVIFLLVRTVVQNFRIKGVSMEPNFHDGQFLFINRFAYCPGLHLDAKPIGLNWSLAHCLWQPQRGDVIVFRYPRDPTEDYIKRVIALPGERVEVRTGEVFVNDRPLPEPFALNPGSYTSPAVSVPPGQVYVMGDNRDNSSDSHLWGPLPDSYIVGRAWLSYWPPKNWGVVQRWEFTTFQAKR